MCGCPPHLVESASQIAAAMGNTGPFAGTLVAALLGGKFGQILMKSASLRRFVKKGAHKAQFEG